MNRCSWRRLADEPLEQSRRASRRGASARRTARRGRSAGRGRGRSRRPRRPSSARRGAAPCRGSSGSAARRRARSATARAIEPTNAIVAVSSYGASATPATTVPMRLPAVGHRQRVETKGLVEPERPLGAARERSTQRPSRTAEPAASRGSSCRRTPRPGFRLRRPPRALSGETSCAVDDLERGELRSRLGAGERGRARPRGAGRGRG